MKVLNLQQNSEEWFDARKGKITGSSLKDIVVKRGNGKKIGFYKLIAERIAVDADGEDVMARGHRLEQEAIAEFERVHNVKTKEVGMWVSDDNDNIAVSPDAVVVGKPWAVEVKCLNSAGHLQAVIENKVPNEYVEQVVQYFIVNEKLQKVFMVFYDPRIIAKPLHILEVNREDYEDDITFLKEYELKTLEEVEYWVEKLTF